MSKTRLLLVALIVAVAPVAAAQTETYTLQPASAYTYGCYPPCLCPIFLAGDLQGSITLDFVNFDGTHNVYDVTLVNVVVVNLAGTVNSVITGTGTYRRPPVYPGDEELTLDVMIDGVPHLLTSGVVISDGPASDILISVAENGFYCFDYVLTIFAQQSASPATAFVRGDCNANGNVDLSDAIASLSVLFVGAATPDCVDACDCNGDNTHNVADPVYALSYLFTAGGAMPPPFPTCGTMLAPMACPTFAACP